MVLRHHDRILLVLHGFDRGGSGSGSVGVGLVDVDLSEPLVTLLVKAVRLQMLPHFVGKQCLVLSETARLTGVASGLVWVGIEGEAEGEGEGERQSKSQALASTPSPRTYPRSTLNMSITASL